MTNSKGSLRWWAYPVLAVGFLVGFPIAIVVVMAVTRYLLLPSVPILHWPSATKLRPTRDRAILSSFSVRRPLQVGVSRKNLPEAGPVETWRVRREAYRRDPSPPSVT